MELEEGRQADQLMRGKKLADTTDRKMLLRGIILALALFAWFGWEAIVYDELDQLLVPAVQLIALAAVCAGVWWYQQNRDAKHEQLKAAKQGAFMHVAGRVHADGIDYLSGDFPVKYQWEDLVGCRVADDVALLYVSFPRQMNYVAASYFDSAQQWQAAKAMIMQNVPTIRPGALRAPRKESPRMTHVAAAVQKLNRHQWPKAVAEFDAVLAIEPSNAQAISGRLIALAASGDFDGASHAAEDSIEHGVNDPTTRLMRTRVMITKERFAEAIPDLNWLVEHRASDAEPLRDRGLVNLKLGRCEDALEDLTKALELNGDDALAFNNRGATLIELGRTNEAIIDLERALEIDPTLERAKFHLDRARSMPCHS